MNLSTLLASCQNWLGALAIAASSPASWPALTPTHQCCHFDRLLQVLAFDWEQHVLTETRRGRVSCVVQVLVPRKHVVSSLDGVCELRHLPAEVHCLLLDWLKVKCVRTVHSKVAEVVFRLLRSICNFGRLTLLLSPCVRCGLLNLERA